MHTAALDESFISLIIRTGRKEAGTSTVGREYKLIQRDRVDSEEAPQIQCGGQPDGVDDSFAVSTLFV